jgi:hemolysin III
VSLIIESNPAIVAIRTAIQSPQEEFVNTLTHGVGLVLSLVGLAVLISRTLGSGSLVGCTIFGASLVTLYLSSTLYHSASLGRRKHMFRLLDHMSIYLLIAGTYTMVASTMMTGVWATVLITAQWGLAAGGIVFKAVFGLRFEKLSVALYIVMGWLGVIALPTLLVQVPAGALWWLLVGGVFYTGGVWFYLRDQRMKYGHAAWHLCVLAGSGSHFTMAILYVPTI